MKKTILLTVLVSFFASASLFAVSQWEDQINLVVGEVASIEVLDPRRVGISDPAIADVDSVSRGEVTLVGKTTGSTTLSIWDKLGSRTVGVTVVGENLEYLKARLEQLLVDNLGLKHILMRVSEPEGKIVMLGKIRPDNEEDFGLLIGPFSDKLINLVKVTEDVLVQIDVQILELSKDDTDTLGIDWSDSLGVNEGTALDSSNTGTTSQSITGTGSELIRITDWTREVLSARINFLMSRGKGRILSRPKLVCLSGKEAEFLVGGQVPIVTSTVSSTGTTSNIEYRDYGITLRIQPIVNEDGSISTKLHTEVSEIDTARQVVTTTAVAPAFATRSLDTEMTLRQGQTIFLAGLIKNKDTTTINKVPGLADIPIIGALFRSKSFVAGDTELVISLTPSIIRSPDQLQPEVAPQAPVPVSVPVLQEDPFDAYLLDVEALIKNAVYYPKGAGDAGWEGRVGLKLHLNSEGALLDADLVNSSGYQVFDDTALSVVRALSPYPAFPKEISSNEVWLEVPVVFRKN